jgi:hypothetical protein
MRIAIRAAGCAALFALLSTACTELPPGVSEGNFGAIDINVVDQFGAPVAEPGVTIVQRSNNQIIQLRAEKASVGGIVRFFNLQAATFQGWADPPPGYAGGGEANAVPITIIAGETITATLRLTKQ